MIGPKRRRALVGVFAALVAAMVLALAGCGNDPGHPATTGTGEYRVVTVNVHGRATACVTWQNVNGHAGGITCDFAHAKR